MRLRSYMRYEAEYSYVSPRTFDYFADNAAAHDLVDAVRWRGRRYCPRCKSTYVKKVNTNIFRELHRCLDCSYMFNSLSGTIFKGAKIPLVKYLQLFVVHNALGDQISMREISYVIDVSYKTAVSLFSRLRDTGITSQFAIVDKERSDRFKTFFENSKVRSNAETFFSYCEMKHIVIDERKFINYLEQLTDIELDDSASSRKEG